MSQKNKKKCCEAFKKGNCPRGEKCPFEHNVAQQQAHQQRQALAPPQLTPIKGTRIVYDDVKRVQARTRRPIPDDILKPDGTIVRACKRGNGNHTFDILPEEQEFYRTIAHKFPEKKWDLPQSCPSCREMKKVEILGFCY